MVDKDQPLQWGRLPAQHPLLSKKGPYNPFPPESCVQDSDPPVCLEGHSKAT